MRYALALVVLLPLLTSGQVQMKFGSNVETYMAYHVIESDHVWWVQRLDEGCHLSVEYLNLSEPGSRGIIMPMNDKSVMLVFDPLGKGTVRMAVPYPFTISGGVRVWVECDSGNYALITDKE